MSNLDAAIQSWFLNWLYACTHCGHIFWPGPDQSINLYHLRRWGMPSVQFAQTDCPKCGYVVEAHREMGTENRDL